MDNVNKHSWHAVVRSRPNAWTSFKNDASQAKMAFIYALAVRKYRLSAGDLRRTTRKGNIIGAVDRHPK